MKTTGSLALPQQFTWTPHQLLTMIKEIDKVCLEEGMLDVQPTNYCSQVSDINTNTNNE
jgi:hypothetical protein